MGISAEKIMFSLKQKLFMAKREGKQEVVLTLEETEMQLQKESDLDQLLAKYMQYVPLHILKYDPAYDRDSCSCGHKYYRHFDPYEDWYPVGCKYCDCVEFESSSDDLTKKVNGISELDLK